MWAAAGSLDSERGRSENLKKGQFFKKKKQKILIVDLNTRPEMFRSPADRDLFVCMCCRWTHPCYVWIW